MSADDEASSTISAGAITVLEKIGGKRSQQLLALVAAVQVLAPVAKWLQKRLDRHENFTIVVDGSDAIYNDLHEWVLDRMPAEDRKAMIASTGDFEIKSEYDRTEVSPRVRLRYDGSRKQSIVIDGHTVTAEVTKESLPGSASSIPENWRSMLERVTFTATTLAGRDAIVKVIDGLIEKKRTKVGPPPLMIPSRYGGSWIRRRDLPARTLDSVILKEGQLERLVTDLEKFLAAEDAYTRVSQPWHRGYLLHGPPGTGKTSVARALAGHFDLPLHYLPLGDLEADADLMGLVAEIRPKSMLLLEDVDSFHAAVSRDEENKVVTVAAMLNALDGIWTPHGMVTVMTTNHKKDLDPALLRAGRVDVDEELTALDAEQAERLSRQMTGYYETIRSTEYAGRSPAEYIQALRMETT